MTFRIVPYGADKWAVQHRLFGFLWWTNIYVLVGIDYYATLAFDTEKEAEGWIWGNIQERARTIQEKFDAERRKSGIKPRVFP